MALGAGQARHPRCRTGWTHLSLTDRSSRQSPCPGLRSGRWRLWVEHLPTRQLSQLGAQAPGRVPELTGHRLPGSRLAQADCLRYGVCWTGVCWTWSLLDLCFGHSAQIRAERGRSEGRLCLLLCLVPPQSSAAQQVRGGYQTAYSRALRSCPRFSRPLPARRRGGMARGAGWYRHPLERGRAGAPPVSEPQISSVPSGPAARSVTMDSPVTSNQD
jgi:hypothetical protein